MGVSSAVRWPGKAQISPVSPVQQLGTPGRAVSSASAHSGHSLMMPGASLPSASLGDVTAQTPYMPVSHIALVPGVWLISQPLALRES